MLSCLSLPEDVEARSLAKTQCSKDILVKALFGHLKGRPFEQPNHRKLKGKGVNNWMANHKDLSQRKMANPY